MVTTVEENATRLRTAASLRKAKVRLGNRFGGTEGIFEHRITVETQRYLCWRSSGRNWWIDLK